MAASMAAMELGENSINCPHDFVQIRNCKPVLERVENASLCRTPQWVQPPQPWARLLLGLSAHEWMNENELQKNKT